VCRGRESDPRPSDYEPLALPLSYLGEGGLYITTQFLICQLKTKK
jgi:hypothetical protein